MFLKNPGGVNKSKRSLGDDGYEKNTHIAVGMCDMVKKYNLGYFKLKGFSDLSALNTLRAHYNFLLSMH